MKPQQYVKIQLPDKKQCEAKTNSLYGKVRCKNSAKYIIGESLLCKHHAKIEALEIILDGYAENGLDFE